MAHKSYSDILKQLTFFEGLKDITAKEEEMQSVIEIIDEISNEVDFASLSKADLSLVIKYLSKTDNLYGINTPIIDSLEESDFSDFDDNLLLMRLPEYSLEIKRTAIEQGVVFTKNNFFPNNISPFEKTKSFLKKISWKISPSADEINFLFFLLEDSFSGYLDTFISKKQKKEILLKTKDYINFNEISYDYERIGALNLILEGANLNSDDKWKSLTDEIKIYNGLHFLNNEDYTERLALFTNKNNIIVINDTIDSFESKIFYLYQSKINYYYDQNREIIKGN